MWNFFFLFYHDAGHKIWVVKKGWKWNCVIPTTLTSMLDIFLHLWYIYIFSIDNKYTSAYLSNLWAGSVANPKLMPSIPLFLSL